ncbi:acyltransferase [Escherichia coli]|uniref:acyltransferase family protein n=1 Tax=Enterobacter cloacae TaxID=550 RepID=UPI001F53AC4C|nr:acyltransferase [Enterobacter cloacae]MCI1184648.1 acyltransferase [Enterobacter cloacae]MCT9036379.1 acyltransferase [Enterobacter cloacae]
MFTPSIISIAFSLSIIIFFIALTYPVRKLVYQNEKLNHSIEGLRGIACILVFVNHSAWMLTNNHVDSAKIDYTNFNYFGNFGSFGVELFFCITGYLFSSKIKSGEFDIEFFGKRIKRLAPAYLFVSLITFILFIVKYNNLIVTFDDISRVIQQIFGFGFFGSGIRVQGSTITSLNVVVWTLPFEWKFYAAIPFIAYCFRRRTILIPLFIFSFFVIYSQYVEDNTLWVYFITGFICSYIKPCKNKILCFACSISALVLIIYIILSNYYQYSAMRVIPISAFFILCVFSNPKWIKIKPLSIAGTLSYSIYLTHQAAMFCIVNIASILFNDFDFTTVHLLILAIISAILTIIASLFLYSKIERRFI